MDEGFLVFYVFVLETVRIQEHGEIFEVVVCESELTWMGLRWNVYLYFVLVPMCFDRLILTTLQVLPQRPPRTLGPRSRWSGRFA